MSEDEIEQRWKARCDLIKAVRARTMALRKEKDALSLGLGDAASVAKCVAKKSKELSKEFKVPPLKGVIRQSTLVKKVSKRLEMEKKAAEEALNPRIKGLESVPGLELDKDGTIGLKALREQRPDIFTAELAYIPGVHKIPSGAKIIAAHRARQGREDTWPRRTRQE